MNEINLDAHYTANSKVNPMQRQAVQPPDYINTKQFMNDAELNKKVYQINNDVYIDSKKEKNKSARNMGLIILATIGAVFGAKMIGKIFKP